MKKQTKALLLAFGILAGSTAFAYAISGNDMSFLQRDPTNTFNQTKWISMPSTPGPLVMDPSTTTPVYATFGSTMSYNASTSVIDVGTVPSTSISGLATVATSGSYTDLSNKPAIGGVTSYEGTTARAGSFPIFKSATVGSGVAVMNFTADGTSGGTALCANGVIQDSVNAFVSDALASYQMSYAFSNSNKTVTITTNKLTTANILTGILGQSAANGSIVKVSVWCY